MPSASIAVAMVLAVYMPPHAPAPGQLRRTISCRLFFADLAGDVLAVALKRTDDVQLLVSIGTGLDCAPIDHDRGRFRRPIAIRQPGMFLSQPGSVINASYHCAPMIVSIESAIRSRLCKAEAHSIGAHRDAVADSDGVESHANQSGIGNTFLDLAGQIQQMHVAAIALVPDASDSDLCLVHVLGSHAGGVEHRLRSTLALGLGDFAAVLVERLVHRQFFAWWDGFEPLGLPGWASGSSERL